MSTEARLEWEDFRRIAPEANAALLALGKAAEDAGLGKELLELIKLRVSQINGCAFCVQLHLNAARKAGVAAEKLDLVAVWRDAGVFSGREQAALAWAEGLTEVSRHGAPDAAYAALREAFDESEAVFLTVAIGTINMWNRIAVGFRFSPQVARGSAERAA